ncbi:cationic peroxidase 1-like protein [Tanacetum coccineum]
MASSTSSFLFKLATFTLCLGFLFGTSSGQLTANFYARTCPNFRSVVTRAVNSAVSSEARMGASLLRLHFHDCFGCDASVLLDDTANFTGEKGTPPNAGSIRGFNVIDTIKTQLESQCAGVVSCADILAAAARDSVVALGGPSWNLVFGRRDSTTANSNLSVPSSSLSGLISSYASQNLSTNEMVALSGAHTIGQARCTIFRSRLANDNNINASFVTATRANCPTSGGDNNLSPLDATPTRFDNMYYNDLINQRGLLHTDQELFNGGSTDALVRTYASNQATFFRDFASAMVKMSNLSPLTGSSGQIRTNCRRIN